MIETVAPSLLSHCLKIASEFVTPKIERLVLVIVIFLLAGSSGLFAQEVGVTDSRVNPPRIQWTKFAGVSRYRVQIAADERFNDVIFDGVVTGYEYLARDLAPSRYHWRVLAANTKTRRTLARGQFEVKKITTEEPTASLVSATTRRVDWLAATGEISNPIAAPLRSSDFDFIGTNAEGNVYALDGSAGTTLWVARYNVAAKADSTSRDVRQFVPLFVNFKDSPSLVIVAFEKGLRALDSVIGQEVWTTELPEGVVGGLVAEFNATSGPHIYLTNDKLNKLICLEAKTGLVRFEKKLNGKPTGPPVALNTKQALMVLAPLQGNTMEVRTSNGDLIRSIKLGAELTTPPIVAETSRGLQILVGTKYGVITFDGNNLQPLERIAVAGNDYPVGSLAVAHLDGDNSAESVVMITKLRRVAAIHLNGRIGWFASNFIAAASAAFADLNGDGRLDVLVPSNDNFAVGLSGIDGSRIWKSPDSNQSSRAEKLAAHPRSLAIVTLKNGSIIVGGNDPSAIGLRALELQTGSITAGNQ